MVDSHAAFNKFNCFTNDLLGHVHNFGGDSFKLLLTNAAPNAANSVKGDLTEISAGFGYPAGGATVTASHSTAGGIAIARSPDVVIGAAGGPIGPFRYVVLYNATAPGGPLVGWWDFGVSVTLPATRAIAVIFDAVNGMFTSQ